MRQTKTVIHGVLMNHVLKRRVKHGWRKDSSCSYYNLRRLARDLHGMMDDFESLLSCDIVCGILWCLIG